jgi:hypothetical protein
MHTYDFDRHNWRYDVGGLRLDNSELATDVWLWLYFLRLGPRRTFRFAESHDASHRRGGRRTTSAFRAARLPAQRHALGGCSARPKLCASATVLKNRRFCY